MSLNPSSNVVGEYFSSETSFRTAIKEDFKFVDKSLFIPEIVANISNIHVILRPRRFGKTKNLDMLRCFLDKEINETEPDIFANLLISKYISDSGSIELGRDKKLATPEEIQLCKGQYYTIHLDMKGVSGLDWNEMRTYFTRQIDKLFRSTKKRLGKWSDALEEYYNNSFRDSFNGKYTKSLYRLTYLIHQATEQKVYLLIDDFDQPFIGGACLMGAFDVIGGDFFRG